MPTKLRDLKRHALARGVEFSHGGKHSQMFKMPGKRPYPVAVYGSNEDLHDSIVKTFCAHFGIPLPPKR